MDSRNHKQGKLIGLLILLASLFVLDSSQLFAAKPAKSEYALKSAYLLNIAKFVQWPDPTGSNASQSFQFCVIGIEQHAGEIDGQIAGKKVHGRESSIQHLSFSEDIDHCQVIFIGEIGATRVAHVLKTAQSKSILIVGEESEFINRGGDVNFFAEPKRLRFEINPLSLEHKGLSVSSKLLRLARILEVPVKETD
ncbi:MAG: YfiR family protein [bacterium]